MIFILPLTEDAEPSLPRLRSWHTMPLLNVDSGELGLRERGVATAPRSCLLQRVPCQKEEVYRDQSRKGQEKLEDISLPFVKIAVDSVQENECDAQKTQEQPLSKSEPCLRFGRNENLR